MKKLIYIFTVIFLSSCIDKKIDFTKDERFNAGIDYETKETIPPTILEYGDYTVVTGISKEYGKLFHCTTKTKNYITIQMNFYCFHLKNCY